MIDTILDKRGFECEDNLDMSGIFYTGNEHSTGYEHKEEDNLIIDAADLQTLLEDEHITGVEIDYDESYYPWISTDEIGIRPTYDGLYAYFIGEVFSKLDKELIDRCESLVTQGKWDTAIREAMLSRPQKES